MARNTKDQRRKQKKQQRQRRQAERRPEAVLPYHGNKYRTEQMVPLHLVTETAIHECDVMSRRRLTDHDIRRAITSLVLGIRHGTPPAGPSDADLDTVSGTPEDLVAWTIRTRLREYVRECGDPGQDNLVGVLRSILGSIETRGSIAPDSRGYLKSIEDFLKKAGVEVREG